jgi:hypothetical protein
MHTYRPGNLRDEIPKEGGFGPPWAVTPWKKKKSRVRMSCGCRLLPAFRRKVLPPSSGKGENNFGVMVFDVRKAGLGLRVLASKWEQGALKGGGGFN